MSVQQKKVISLLGKKNTGKKTPKEDSEFGLLRLHPNIHYPFTPPPTKKACNFPQYIKIEILEW